MMLSKLVLSLCTLFFFLFTLRDVEAAPLSKKHKILTLPLTRLQQRRTDLHPQVLLQQHINRGHRRLALMSDSGIGPTDEELRASLHKRVHACHPNETTSELQKRYNPYVHSAVESLDTPTLNLHEDGSNSSATSSASAASASASASNRFTDAEINALLNGGVTDANTPTANNSLGLDILADDVGYTSIIEIGTPPRQFRVLMDSGSADLWVGSDNCQAEGGGDCGNHTFLGEQRSSSFSTFNEQWNITYGTGSVSGVKIADDVTIAGLALTSHSFGIAEVESVDFASDNTDFDGLMGLAQSTLSNQDFLTPVESLAKNGLISEAITSYKISRLADGKNDGEITFGGLDETKFQADTLVTVDNISKQGFWIAALDAVSVNGTDLKVEGQAAILDTGTTLLIVPAADAETIHSNIDGATSDGQGGFLVPCTTNASIALTFGGTAFAIDPRDLAFAPLDINDPTGMCVSGISSGNVGQGEWLVGDTFLKSAYFSTNVDKNQLSLAKLA
ncbi:acid protease [Guyanagaster necrorhizus]|uniref:Acid protease n=1 Tax=Guyanagaster necrorhizus TaxID=856835 RepID=A0A9P7W2V7_9AGAR|nr:acid protease [Guyanagaster necrorhizus MCA 3950]KAG7451049.1 acid protease [Guyanagaster necrorhizus MCA 3950]